MTLLPQCVCGATGGTRNVVHSVPIVTCASCGVVRQDLDWTPEQLAEWYQQAYHAGHYYHTPEQDQRVAVLRHDAYKFQPGLRVLDVGAANNAFVNEGRARGIEMWGQDLASQSAGKWTYVGALEDIAFPTGHFDAVTVHDVLEHAFDPKAMLQEIARILKPGGFLMLDFPRFFHAPGERHWKFVEHLWMFTEHQLRNLLQTQEFTIEEEYHPIASKVVFWAQRKAVRRPQILVPAGIGDAYWVLTKLPGFLREHGLGLPDVWVQDGGGPRRTQPFLETIPFVHAAGYKPLDFRHPIFHEAYMQNARTVFPGFEGLDYFLAYNGVMRFSRRLEDVDPQYGCDWYPKMFVSKVAQESQAACMKNGRYIVVYLVHAGMYRRWLHDFPQPHLEETLLRLERELDARIVLVGAEWDKESLGMVLARRNPHWINLIGETTYEMLQGILRGAHLIFGYPSGATLIGPAMHVPTLLLWNDYFQEGFWHAAAPAKGYRALPTLDLTPEIVVQAARALVGDPDARHRG